MMMILLILILLIISAQGIDITSERDMLKHLLDGYDRRVRPVKHSSNVINVKIELELNMILGLDGKNTVMTSHVSFAQSWEDEFLHWNSSEYNSQSFLNIPRDDIWGLDLYVKNSVGETKDALEAFHRLLPSYAIASQGGECMVQTVYVLYTDCDMDLETFPFDIHTCNIGVGSWMYVSEQVSLELTEFPIRLESGRRDFGEWYLTDTSAKKEKVPYGVMIGDNWTVLHFDEITFSLTLKRNPHYYIINIVVPTALVGIISIFSFLMTPGGDGRISLCLTALLATAVYAMVVADKTPEATRGIPTLSCLLFLYMGIMTASTLWAVIISHIISHSERYQFPSICAKSSCSGCKRQRKKQINTCSKKQGIKLVGLDQDGDHQMEPLNNHNEGETSNQAAAWEKLILCMDKILFVIFLGIYLFGNLAFLL